MYVNKENTLLKTLPTVLKIPETMPVGIEIFRVNVTDDDAEPHGDLTYKITGNKQQALLHFVLNFFYCFSTFFIFPFYYILTYN